MVQQSQKIVGSMLLDRRARAVVCQLVLKPLLVLPRIVGNSIRYVVEETTRDRFFAGEMQENF